VRDAVEQGRFAIHPGVMRAPSLVEVGARARAPLRAVVGQPQTSLRLLKAGFFPQNTDRGKGSKISQPLGLTTLG
jgi:hypothetical protein